MNGAEIDILPDDKASERLATTQDRYTRPSCIRPRPVVPLRTDPFLGGDPGGSYVILTQRSVYEGVRLLDRAVAVVFVTLAYHPNLSHWVQQA